MIVKDLFKSDNLAQHVILQMVTAHAEGVADIHDVPGWENLSGTDLDVRLTVEGVEVPFELAMERMEEASDRWVRERAAKMFDEKLHQTTQNVIHLTQQFAKAMRDIAREKLGIELDDDD